MQWWRTKRRFGGWLALAALALQLALSFGHIHAEDFAGISRHSTAVASAATPGTPWHPGDHDGCAVCATVHMLGSLVAAVPPLLPQPTAFTIARRDVPPSHVVATSRGGLTKARAPPV
jgi:hypothetical protein